MLENTPRVTRNLIIINCIVFIGDYVARRMMHSNIFTEYFALFYPSSAYFHPWQPLTYMFMHGNFLHIFFNMYTLYMFGGVLERMIGEKKFLLFYILCGLGAAGCHIGVQALESAWYLNAMADGVQNAAGNYYAIKMIPTVGASGAVYGLIIGYAMMFPDSRLTLLFPPVTLTAKWMVIIFVVIEFLTGITGTMSLVAHFAHLGGMLIGFLLIFYWKKRGTLFDRENF